MAHALLSPSSASQWLTCTPSPRLTEGYEDSSSDFADEGTLAHSYAETFLTHHSDSKALKKALKAMEKDKHYEKHYSPELVEHASNFADYVLEQCVGDHALEVEQKLDLRNWVPEGFGTGDAIVVKDGILNLNDLKFGRGVRVSSVENKQLMIYGLGCIDKYSWIYDFHTIRLHIYQPRINNISVWSITVDELVKWGEEELKPKAKLAWDGAGTTVAGEHCRFCKVKGECKSLAEFSLSILKDDFKEAHLLTPEEIGEILPKVATVEIFLKAIHDHAYGSLLGGGTIPGYKLVKGRPTRVYTDVDDIRKALNDAGYTDDAINVPPKPPTLLTLTAMEKMLKKKEFDKIVAPYVKRVDGKPAIAPESDKRDEYIMIEAEFADELENDWVGE